MAYVPCPSCRFLIGPTDTTCRWCKVDLEEALAAKTRLKPPGAGARPVDFVAGKKRRLGRSPKAAKDPKPGKAGKAAKQPATDIDLEALHPKKRAPTPAPLPVPVAVAAAAPVAAFPEPVAPPLLTAPTPVMAAPVMAAPVMAAPVMAAPVMAPPPPAPVIAQPRQVQAQPRQVQAQPRQVQAQPRQVQAQPRQVQVQPPPVPGATVQVAAQPVPVEEMSVFARLAAPNYLIAPSSAPLVEGYVAPTTGVETGEAPVTKAAKIRKAPRERRPPNPGKGGWRYTTATLVTLGVIAASMATASYVVNRPSGTTATTVATTTVATTTAPVVPAAWLAYAAPDASFTVEMPVSPTVKTAPSASDPTISETTYDAIAGGTALKVTSYPHAIDASQVHDLLQSFKNSALTVEGSSLISEQETTIGGRPALTYTVAQTATTLFFTEIFDGDRVYTLVSALGPTDSARFVMSLVIAPHVAN